MRRRSASTSSSGLPYDPDSLSFAPFLLLPSPFPRASFNLAVDLQKDLNLLMHRVASDEEFLRQTLAATIKVCIMKRSLLVLKLSMYLYQACFFHF
jgi:hypothetical protein